MIMGRPSDFIKESVKFSLYAIDNFMREERNIIVLENVISGSETKQLVLSKCYECNQNICTLLDEFDYTDDDQRDQIPMICEICIKK